MPVQGPEPPVAVAGQQQRPLPRGHGSDSSDLNLNPLASSPQYASPAMGQSSSSESKGLKRAGPYMRGAASSFGFRRSKGANNNDKAALDKRDYSQEALEKEQHNVTTAIKASPGLARAAKDVAGAAPGAQAPPRTNRFGFRTSSSSNANKLSNKVGDSSAQVLAKQGQQGKAPVGPPARPAPAQSQPRPAAHKPSPKPSPSPRAAGRPSPPNSLPVTRHGPAMAPGRPASSFLPRPGRGRGLGAKDAKTAANIGTRGRAPIATCDDELMSSKDSSMNEDSGLGSQAVGDTDTLHGVDILDISPGGARLRRVAQSSRRSLREEDDDPNVITEIVPIAKMVSRASLRSLVSLGAQNPSPQRLSARGSPKSISAKSVSSDEFHTDSSLFRGYGEGLDDTTEAKVYIDGKTAEKRRSLNGRFMKDYGPEQDEDWGQGEAMAEGEWKDEVNAVVVIDEEVCGEVQELRSSLGPVVAAAEVTKLADLVAGGGLIEDESAPEDSLFSSSASSSDPEDSTSPAKRSQAGEGRRKVRTKKKEREAKDEVKDLIKASCKVSENSTCADKKGGHTLSPEGSGTPSNSFSLSDGRDFLIDDEIIDQPALTYHNKLHGDDSELASITESAASLTLRESSHHQALPSGLARALKRAGSGAEGSPSLGRGDNTLRLARFGSMDSLATNSIDSEDLMMDFEDDADSGRRQRPVTKSWAGSPVTSWPRPRKSRSFSFVDLDELRGVESFARSGSSKDNKRAKEEAEARARSKSVGGAADDGDLADGLLQCDGAGDDLLADNDSVLLELSSLIESISSKDRVKDRSSSLLVRHSQPAQPRALSQVQAPASSGPSSAPDSPRLSLGSSGVPSPLRPPRQLASSDSDESAMMRVDRGTYQHMYQDVVHIKTMLLKLKRVLQEAETLNPFESSLKNGLLHQLVHADESGEDDDGRTRNPGEEVVDLKRQMVLMKQQMEEKDRTIQLMQLQMMKYERVSEDTGENGQPADMCNAATQTERIRPVSAGPSLLQSLPSDSNGVPLVSWTDTWGRRSRTPASGGNGNPVIESRTSSTSRVPTIASRNSRSIGPGRLGMGSSGDTPSPSSIPLVKGNHRKTGTAIDTVPNTRRPPVVAAPRKAISSSNQKP
ncbi:uncharacterized protein LOC113211966 isoform X2 [Frankliniella occidentalis]|uniref:Uncharacterized protein LOC113211966 isoform X2 n=1 Tax=Frankliniella occidentalis TaxID=133901 RepID=A0A6J1SYI2_FRAOC|nr:uncharacterized protein LOC113211966 isoform X2 [Frankliniella occidentalis]